MSWVWLHRTQTAIDQDIFHNMLLQRFEEKALRIFEHDNPCYVGTFKDFTALVEYDPELAASYRDYVAKDLKACLERRRIARIDARWDAWTQEREKQTKRKEQGVVTKQQGSWQEEQEKKHRKEMMSGESCLKGSGGGLHAKLSHRPRL
ncbi:hypothetical protein QTJ16_001151 [Diplocarpon rosae]|uniref:Uncharacterized protein n=1 Tax=Diplocarpon rosae TaxID=946125 RepID=A0AAD9WHU2_9HELO|nr:hypothetical protein QTJ16_001151 [Diplocarpon rosae]